MVLSYMVTSGTLDWTHLSARLQQQSTRPGPDRDPRLGNASAFGFHYGFCPGWICCCFSDSFPREKNCSGKWYGTYEADQAGSRCCLHAVISWSQESAKGELSFPLQGKVCPSKLRDLVYNVSTGVDQPVTTHRALLPTKCPGA